MANFRKWSKLYGYDEIDPPAIEDWSHYERQPQSLTRRLVKLVEPSGRIGCLKIDNTLSCASMTLKLPEGTPIRRISYSSKVFRYGQSGEIDEVLQLGCENYTDLGSAADVEVIRLALDVLESIGIPLSDLRFEIGNSSFYKAIAETVELPVADVEQMMTLIEEKRLTTLNGFLKQMALPEDEYEFLSRLPGMFGDFETIYSQAVESRFGNACLVELKALESLYKLLKSLGLTQIQLDLSQGGNEFRYYSGNIYRIFSQRTGKALATGGRYDGMSGVQEACGISFNTANVIEWMKTMNSLLSVPAQFDYAVLCDIDDPGDALQISAALRDRDFSVVIARLKSSISDTFDQPECRAAQFVLSVEGEDAVVFDQQMNESRRTSVLKLLNELEIRGKRRVKTIETP
jgi:ATP phosphoribosyltransferase regulatory subunit